MSLVGSIAYSIFLAIQADPLAVFQKEDELREKEGREVAVLSVLAVMSFTQTSSICLLFNLDSWFEFNTDRIIK